MTNDSTDPSVDVWRSATLPLVRQLTGLEDGLALKVARRGAAPELRREPPADLPKL